MSRRAVSHCVQHSCRQEDDGFHQLQYAAYRDAYDAERKQEQPHDRVEHKGEERKRPAENEKNAPKQEFHHGVSTSANKVHYLLLRFRPCLGSVLRRLLRARAESAFFRSRMALFRSFSGSASRVRVRFGRRAKMSS